tara:strand:- start:1339 stop:5490 length:4152 start_codon:yes stop_codon:yes gene_type:complete
MNEEELLIEEEDQTLPESELTLEEPIPTNAKQLYPSAFGASYGNSTVDLSDKANKDKMLEEYREWFGMDKGEQRDNIGETFHQKYYNMSYPDKVAAQQQAMSDDPYYNPVKRLQNVFQGLSVPGLAYADFANDALGTLVPGYNTLDEKWDKATQLDNPIHQKLRSVLSIVLPSIHAGGKIQGGVNTFNAGKPWFQRLTNTVVAQGLGDAAIVGLSDVGEENNVAQTLADNVPGLFGPKGRIPLPEWVVTKDSDSPAVRKMKNMLESAPFAVFGTVIGAGVDKLAGRKMLDWMEPLDDSALQYKQTQLELGGDTDKIVELQEIRTQLSLGSKNLSKQNENILINRQLELENELGIIDNMDDASRIADNAAQQESQEAAIRKIENPDQLELFDGFDGDINPGILDEASTTRQTPPPGNVARNMADTTAIKTGASEGDPAPIITEAMRRKGLMVGPGSRGAVMGVAEEARDIGRFNAVVDGFRFSTKQMNAAAWDIYTSIMAAGNMDEVRALFYDNRDVKNLLLGRFKVDVINEEQARAAAFAMRDLVDRFLGREVTQTSARVMDTLGREANTMAESLQQMQPYVDEPHVMDLVIDKMQFLMDEYGLNKYISGWQLRNKNWFDQVPPRDLDQVIENLTSEFITAENAIHAKNIKFTKLLKKLKNDNPLVLRPLMDAFAHTNGDVDTLAKLHTWAADQITPLGMLKSPDPKQLNLFARSAWSVVYNNVLSGLSAFRAGVGNGTQLILKPITAVLGHGFYGMTDDFAGLKRTFYYNGAVFETNRRALSDAFTMMKKAHQDPDMMIKAYRKDFVFKSDRAWDIMEDMRKVYEAEGNFGRMIQLDTATRLKQLGQFKWMRYGMTGMVFPDVFTSTHLAHYLSRTRAYDDVFSDKGFADWTEIFKAERNHYKSMFDDNGLIKDQVLRATAGEVQLNLDDGLARWINQGTTAYPFVKFLMMFPRTSSNYIKAAASWTPISLIPGINKYSKTLYAKTDDDIAAALLEHGIDMARTPNARVIWENLRAEYTGRMAFSSMLVGSLWQYAMAGNIRGNGHYNASRRNKERNQMGYEPKTVRIGNSWVSYEGIIGIEHILAPLGDMAYYARDMDESMLENFTSKLTWTVAATFLNQTPLQGLEPLISVTNGDLTGWSRLTANTLRSFLPLSGGAGVLSNAITSSQKDIEAEITSVIKNRLPGFSSTLPEQIDIWTGQPLNDVDNPFLRVLNSISPVQVSGTREPWRVWLQETGWNGLSMLKKDSTGSYEYTPDERELINKYIGEQQMFRQLERIIKNPRYQKEIEQLKLYRQNNSDFSEERIKLHTEKLPVFKEINNIVKNAQKIAELRLLRERPDIESVILNQQRANQSMSEGDVQGAIRAQKRNEATQELLNMRR